MGRTRFYKPSTPTTPQQSRRPLTENPTLEAQRVSPEERLYSLQPERRGRSERRTSGTSAGSEPPDHRAKRRVTKYQAGITTAPSTTVPATPARSCGTRRIRHTRGL